MKKITLMIAALLAFLPITQAWAFSSKYYAQLKTTVKSGSGSVYAATSSTAESSRLYDASSSTSSTKSTSSSGGSVSGFYAYAKPAAGWKFVKWTNTSGASLSTSADYANFSLNASSTKNGTQTTEIWAYFEKEVLPSFNITFETSSAGSYTVDGAAPANKSELTEATSVVLKSTDPNFLSWVINGSVVNNNPYTLSCTANTTVSAEFLTPDQVTSVTTISDLTAALANNAYKKIIVPSGTEIMQTSGTLTVPSDKQLVVDGTIFLFGALSNSGTISGTGIIAKTTKTVTQGAVVTPANTYTNYPAYKYQNTSISSRTVTVSGTTPSCNVKWAVELSGDKCYIINSEPDILVCSIDQSVAKNHITKINSSSSAFTHQGGYQFNGSTMILLTKDTTMSLNDNIKDSNGYLGFQGMVDCAGYKLTLGSEAKSNFYICYFNGKFQSTTCVNIKVTAVNSTDMTIKSWNAKSGNKSARFIFYDHNGTCSWSRSASGETTDMIFFYSGTFTSSITYEDMFSVHGGSFKTDPAKYLFNADDYKTEKVGDYFVVKPNVVVASDPVVTVNGTEFADFSEALSEAQGSGSPIVLINKVVLDNALQIDAGANIVIRLDGHSLECPKITNYGILQIEDLKADNKGEVSAAIENHGTLHAAFGTYSGAISNYEDGTFIAHNGVFSGGIAKLLGVVEYKGGRFPIGTSVTLPDGYGQTENDGYLCVFQWPNSEMVDATVSGGAGWSISPYSTEDWNLLYGYDQEAKTSRTDYTNSSKWQRIAELLAFYEIYKNKTLDASIVFDRDVPSGTLTIYGQKNSTSAPMTPSYQMVSGVTNRLLSAAMIESGLATAALTYSRLFTDKINSVGFSLSNKDSTNHGTISTVLVELWDSVRGPGYTATKPVMITNTVAVLSQKRFTIGAGSNKAMIRQETGAATFYATVAAAVAAAEDGGTVLLANDSADAITLSKSGTFIVDPNGFALSGEASAVDPYFIEKTEEVDSIVVGAKAVKYTVGKKAIQDESGNTYGTIQEVVEAGGAEVTITIPETTTEQTVELPQDTTLTVVQAEGSETVVNVTPVEGYFVEATVVEPTVEQSGTTTVYESKKITEEVVTVTEESVQELNVKLEEFQAGSTETNEVVEVAKIVEAVNNLMENKALERADNVEQAKSETISLKAIVITPKAIVQEVQASATEEKVVKAAAFDVTPTDANNNKIENTSFTFRLPVADGMTGSMVVFHEKAFFGVYPILSWSDGSKLHKYIEITSSEFSEYSYEPRRGVEYAVAKIGDVGYDSLEDAVAAAAAGAKVELLMGTTLTNEIAVAKQITLDLGEYTVTAATGKSAIQVVANGNLTIQGTGKIVAESTQFALYTDYELSPGAKTITIKGGVFDGAVQFNKYPLHTSATQSGEAAVPTRVTIDGGTFNGRVSIYHAPFTVNAGTFEQGLDTSDGSVTVYANYRTPVTFNGGSFKVRPTPAGSRVVVNGGVYYDNGYFKVGSTAACEATRNGTYYASLAEAFQNIGPNTVITVLGGEASSISVALEPGQSLTVPYPFAGTIAGKDGAALDVTYDNASGTATYRVRGAGLARIEGTYYGTLQAAFDAAVAGDTVTLLGNDTLAFTTLDRAITLDLNGHDVTVTSDAADLSAGALTVVGSGRMTGLKEPSAGKQNLVLKGGTYGFNPAKYAPFVIEALPNEKDSLDWNNDRHYVFKNAAFSFDDNGFPGWTSDSGVWTVVPVPKAYVSRIANPVSVDAGDPLNAAYTFNSFNTANGDSAIADKVITGDGQLNLNALTDPSEIARAMVMLQEVMPFLGWHADFAVSFDKPITAGSLTLAGQYDGWSSSWVSYQAGAAVSADVVRRLLVDEGGASVDDWSFEHICTKVKVFNCGARMEDSSISGTTMKVQLRLYAPDSDEGTGSPSICICEYKYTFGGKAARIVREPAIGDFDTIDGAIAAVQSNEVVVVLNDYTGAVDLNNGDKPFTVNRNGFELEVTSTNNINSAEGTDWHFDRMSNGSWSYYNKPSNAVMVEVVDQEGDAVSLSTLTPDPDWLNGKVQEGESNEEALAKIEENGLPAWQNYVIGQDPNAAVRVDTEQAPIEDTPVANTLAVTVPENSGFTVTYELDKIEADGTVVVEGTSQTAADSFSINLEDATANESGVAYYKLTAVIEATDGSGATTKVTSENTIGVLVVTNAPAKTIIPVPWESLADGQNISVSNLVRTATLAQGDKIQAYDASTGKYWEWTLNANKEWEPSTTVTGNAELADSADRYTIPRGAGVWLLRGAESANNPIYFVGEVADDSSATSSLAAASDEDTPSWNLVGNPTTEEAVVKVTPNDGDQILVPTGGAPINYTYDASYNNNAGGWYYITTEPVYRKGKQVGVRSTRQYVDNVTIPAGTGFWYLNAGEDSSVTW